MSEADRKLVEDLATEAFRTMQATQGMDGRLASTKRLRRMAALAALASVVIEKLATAEARA